EFAFCQSAGNGFAHLRNRYLFKTFFTGNRSGSTTGFGFIVFYIASHNSAVVARAADTFQVYAFFFSQFFGQGRGFYPAVFITGSFCFFFFLSFWSRSSGFFYTLIFFLLFLL